MDPADDPEIRAIAMAEAHARLREVAAILAGGRPDPDSTEFQTLCRHAHSLKSLANVLGSRDAEAACVTAMTTLDDVASGGVRRVTSEPRLTQDLGDVVAGFARVDPRSLRPH